MTVAMVLAGGALVFLVASTVRSIQDERSRHRSIWREFGLGLILMLLFLGTWVAHLVAEWQVYTDHQRQAGERTQLGDFVATFAQSTLENWQSEFLQLFSFVVLAALYIHKGSAESKDGSEKLEASLRRIEERIGTWPGESEDIESWQLPDTPLQSHDQVRASTHG